MTHMISALFLVMLRKFIRNNFSVFVLAFVLVILSCAFGTAWSADENGITLIQPTGGTVSYKIKNEEYDFGSNSLQDHVYLSNTPNDGWSFVRYIVKDESGNDITLSTKTEGGTGETIYFFLKQNATVTAEFEEAAHSITVTQPTGGTVTASATKASEGDRINLSYTVSDGYLFRRFIVTKASDSSEVEVENGSHELGQYAWYFIMPDGAVTVTAEISGSHAITVQNPENGSINVHENGNVNARLSSAATGDSVEVIVGASIGYAVKSYAVTKTDDPSVSVSTAFIQGGTGTDTVIFSFTMPDYPVTVSAQTEAMAYQITWNATDCTVNGPSQGDVGDTITFTVTPSDGYSVRTITVNNETTYGIVRESVNGGVYTYKMTLGTDAFLNNGYTVNVECDNEGEPGFLIKKQFNMGGAIITNSAGEEITRAEGGEQVTIKLLESTGVDYSTCYFYPTGTDYSDPNEIKYANQLTGDNTFTMPFRDMTVVTNGTAQTFNLTVVSGIEHGTVTANSSIPAYNFNVTLTITPDTGYVLTKLIVDGADVASQVNGNEYTFNMPAHDVSVSEAVFSLIYTISYDLADGSLEDGVSNPTTYTIETETFTLNNPTKDGYTFAGWTGTEISGTSTNVTIPQGSTGNRSYVATWKSLSPFGYTESYTPDGSSAKPYKISGVEGWNLLADELNGGESYSGKIFSLEGNLEVTTMLGMNGTGFAGTFEGNGKTLTFNYEGDEDYCAPFRNVNGGTIKDLTVTGTIKTSGQHVGGIVGQSSGETTIEACIFVGKLLTTNESVTIGGGFVAENNGTLTISKSLYAPATLSDGETEPSATGTTTFSRNTESHTSEIMNSYYTRKLGTEQGKQSYTVTAETGITVALAEGSTNGLSFDGTIYAGSNETVSLTISGGNTKEGYTFKGYSAGVATLTESDGKYSLTMPAANVTISANFAENVSYKDANGNEATASDYTVMTSDMTNLTAGTYVVKESVTVSALTLAGDVNLILCDGATLTVTEGVSGANSLEIYGQSGGTGTLIATTITLTENKSLSVYGGTLTAGTINVAGTVTVRNATVNGKTYDANGDSTTSYTVTFDSNGGSAVTSQTLKFKYGEIVKATKPADPTRDNYGFVTWLLNDKTYDFATVVSRDITLTADWAAIVYDIEYLGVDGATNNNPTSYTVEDEITLTEPTKNGSTFAGWTGTGLTQAMMTVTIANGSTGDREYTATWTPKGGKSQEDDPNKPTFAKHSLTLDGEIGVNFYMNLPQLDGVDYTDQDKCYMEFDVSGDQSNAWQYYNPNFKFGDTNYCGFRCFVSSVQMADTIIATLHYGNNLTISQDYSVKEYTDAILENGSFSAEVNNLMIAIQDYGHFSQLMLSKANNWTIGEEFTEMPGSFTGTYGETSEIAQAKDGVKDFAIERDTGDSGIERVEMKLLLDSKTTINLYLHVKDSYTGEVSATLDNGTTNVAKKLSDKKYLVQIMNIPVHELGDFHTIKVAAGTEFNVKVAALSYIHGVLNTEAESIGNVDITTMKNAVTALYRYYDAAMKYKASISN